MFPMCTHAVQVTIYAIIIVYTVLPQITALVLISFQQFLTRLLNETDVYYQKKHMLFIVCGTC